MNQKNKQQKDDGSDVVCTGWGLANYGQLGACKEKESQSNPCKFEPSIIKCVNGIFGFTAGDFHSILITDALTLSSAGQNIYGQLGNTTANSSSSSSTTFTPIKALESMTIESVACGSCHNLALTTDNEVFGWGLNIKGQLGTGSYESIYEPQLIESLIPQHEKKNLLAELALNAQNNMQKSKSLTRNNNLYMKSTYTMETKPTQDQEVQRSMSSDKKLFSQSMECTKQMGNIQLVKENKISHDRDRDRDRERDSEESKQSSRQSLPSPLCTLNPREKVIEIASGALHSLVRTNSRRIFSAGFGGCYALGAGDGASNASFKPIEFFSKTKLSIVKICCGANMSGCISQDGCIYVWGLVGVNENNNNIIYKIPTLISLDRQSPIKNVKRKAMSGRPVDLKMGEIFTVALTETGAIYSWGANNCGQLGIGSLQPRNHPSKVVGLPDYMAQIACGNTHCIAISKDYQIFVWGSNLYGQLGTPSINKFTATPVHLKSFEKAQPFKIACGSYHTLCISYAEPDFQFEKNRRAVELSNMNTLIDNSDGEIKKLKAEVSRLKLDLAKSEKQNHAVQNQRIKKKSTSPMRDMRCSTKPDSKIGWRPFFEIKVENLIFEEKLTEGGYGIVHIGKWNETKCAIKEIKIEYVSQDKLDEFLTECTVMEIVRHPNIVLFLGACTKPPRLCVVLEFCEMGSLWTLLHFTKTELPWKIRKQIAIDIAKGTNYLHSFPTPLLHRDLKSLNILLDNNLTAKLADFGWARIKETLMTGKIGTYQWMAPEVIACSPYTEKADVYSFAIIMWELAIRKPPYYGIEVNDVAERVVHHNLRPPIKDGEAPYSWISLMRRCWNKDPSTRPTFPQIIRELESIQQY